MKYPHHCHPPLQSSIIYSSNNPSTPNTRQNDDDCDNDSGPVWYSLNDAAAQQHITLSINAHRRQV